MSEFVVKIEDDIVQSVGRKSIEQHLQTLVAKAVLNLAARDVLENYNESEVSDTDSWKQSWQTTFENDRYSSFIKVYANV